MKAIIWKEVRENLKWALLGMVLFSAALVYAWYQTVSASYWGSFESIGSGMFQLVTTIGSATLGIGLGLLQVLPESQNRDRWAFLVHRPIPRRTLFVGKSIAGIGLYLLATILPFSIAVAWASIPGKVAGPWDWRMSLAGYADILTGSAYYFAGVLTGLRQARWYGSRGLGIAAAVMCSLHACSVKEFWVAIVGIALFASLIGIAAWGSFLSAGQYRGQPKVGRIALGLTLLLGIATAGTIAICLLISIFVANPYEREQDPYAILKDGTMVRIHYSGRAVAAITDLDGKPMPFSKEALRYYYREMLSPKQLKPSSRSIYFGDPGYRSVYTCFQWVGEDNDQSWFFVERDRLFAVYSQQTRRIEGVLGTNGFFASDTPGARPFTGSFEYWSGRMNRKTFAFPGSVFWVDTFERKTVLLFTTSDRHEITGACDVGLGDDSTPSIVESAAVATQTGIKIISSHGSPIFETPYHYKDPYRQILVVRSPQNDHYFIWYRPWTDKPGEKEALLKLPSYIVEFSAEGRVIQQRELPPIPSRHQSPWWMNPLESHPVILLCTLIAAGLICAWAARELARKHSFSRRQTWTWCAIVFLTNLPGLLTFLCIQEWPARENCPACGKKRVVDREFCEHCGAEFEPPTRDGTEILEKGTATPE